MTDLSRALARSAQPRHFTRSRAVVLTSAALTLVLIAPVLAISVPWFCDLFFHMARMAILENPDAPYIRDWYRVEWQLLPNLGLDLIVPGMAQVMGTQAATRVFVAATLALIFTGTVALHRAIHRQVMWLPLAACLFVYNWIVFLGFFNFLFGVGLMLWALALWFHCRQRPIVVRLMIGAVAAIVLYVCHLFALGLFGVAVASGEAGVLWYDRPLARRDIARCIAAATVPFIVPAILLATSRTAAASTPNIDYVLAAKVLAGLVPFVTVDLPVDLAIAAATIVLVYVLIRERAVYVAREMRFALVALPVLVFVMPTSFFGTDLGDFRLPSAGIFLAIAACRPNPRRAAALHLGIAVGIGCLFALRMTAIVIDFAVAESEIRAIASAFHQLKPGAVVFTGTFEDDSFVIDLFERPESWLGLWHRRSPIPFRHIGTLASLYQPVFVPEATMIDGQQPVEMLSPYGELKALQSHSHVARSLADGDALQHWLGEIRQTLSARPYGFTAVYVALADPNGAASPPPGVIELFSEYGYRIWDTTGWMADPSGKSAL
jgi:hypothetical protein